MAKEERGPVGDQFGPAVVQDSPQRVVLLLRRAGAEELSWEGPTGGKRGVAGDNRSYVVQASTDEGSTWVTLAVGAKENTLDVDPADFADANHVRFRVLTTNGVAYSEASTDDVALEAV